MRGLLYRFRSFLVDSANNKNISASYPQYIAIAKSRCKGGVKTDPAQMLERIQRVYDERVLQCGPDEPTTLGAGMDLARALDRANHCLEAEKLITRLTLKFRRINGPNHKRTKTAEKLLGLYRARYVYAQFKHQWFMFQALRYEDGMKRLVLRGPIDLDERDETKEGIETVDVGDTLLDLHTTVTCHGLQGEEEHLNGKIGELKSKESVPYIQSKATFDDMNLFSSMNIAEATGNCRYMIHFDCKEIQPCYVKHKNLRIVFDLLEVEED